LEAHGLLRLGVDPLREEDCAVQLPRIEIDREADARSRGFRPRDRVPKLAQVGNSDRLVLDPASSDDTLVDAVVDGRRVLDVQLVPPAVCLAIEQAAADDTVDGARGACDVHGADCN
jgi:hypothetical protein